MRAAVCAVRRACDEPIHTATRAVRAADAELHRALHLVQLELLGDEDYDKWTGLPNVILKAPHAATLKKELTGTSAWHELQDKNNRKATAEDKQEKNNRQTFEKGKRKARGKSKDKQ